MDMGIFEKKNRPFVMASMFLLSRDKRIFLQKIIIKV